MSSAPATTLDTLAVLLVVGPLAGAGVVAALGAWPRTRRLADVLTVLVAAVTLVAAGLAVHLSRGGGSVVWLGGWRPRHGESVGIALVADRPALLVVVLVAVLTLVALAYSWHFLEDTGSGYQVLMLTLLGSMAGFCLAGDLFNAFVWFEVMGVGASALTGMRIEEPRSVHGALTFAVVNSVGGSFSLVGIALLYARTGELDLAAVGRQLAGRQVDGLVLAATVLLFCGVLVKLAVVPFHFWTADAEAVAPTPVCVMLSGAMITVSAFALARWWWVVFSGAVDPAVVERALLAFGAVTAVVAALMCTVQRHVKRLLAYSTVSHAGVLLCAVGLLSSQGLAAAGLYAVGHAATKGALFLVTGNLLNRFGTVDEHELHGVGRGMPGTCLLFVLGGLSLAGLPPLGTWTGKSALEEASHAAGTSWLPWVVAFSSVLTGASVLRVAGRVWLGLGPPLANDGGHGEEPENDESPRHRWWLTVPPWVLLVAGVGVVLPPVRTAVTSAAGSVTDASGYAAAVLQNTALPAVHLGAAPLWTMPGVLSGVLSAVAAVGLAAAMIWSRSLAPLIVVRRLLRVPLGMLQGVHRAHLGDYVGWLLLGTGVLGLLVFS
ncbi:MAG: complex I subunit 5 family protein [Nocardioidaceae bacterium]